MKLLARFAVLLPFAFSVHAEEPVLGGPCEGCENVFIGMPSELSSEARIAPADAAGDPMQISGVVRDQVGNPVPGVIVYAYSTNSAGIYPEDTANHTRHGAYRGWVKTGDDGSFLMHTIRPGHYPKTDIPEHVHMHVIEPGCGTYYVDDMVFLDDPLLTEKEKLAREKRPRGGQGMIRAMLLMGTWYAIRDITLGENIPGYHCKK
ncbi:hypothetical protein [Ahniella affigens]|nr:hypothetical protein [Ahniella affigens]